MLFRFVLPLALLLAFALVAGATEPLPGAKVDRPIALPVPNRHKALTWLARNQQPDGSWKTDLGANRQALVVTTSFCALALMASGERYRDQVERAADYVARDIFEGPEPGQPPEWDQSNWKIGIGGLFLCEHYARLEGRGAKHYTARHRQVVDRLVAECLKRMEASGGWGHTPRVKNALGYVETEVMSNWMLATLGAARKLGARIDTEKLNRPLRFIEDTCAPGKGGVGYSPAPGQKGYGCPCRTGGALFAFAILGQQKHPLCPRMLASWRETVIESDGGHGSVALGLIGSALGAHQVGAKDWQDFRERFFPKVLAAANKDGSFAHLVGTTPQSVGGADSRLGKAYNTGIYALLLQLDRGRLTFLGQRWD